jgi:hypothetical protein
MQKPSIYRGFLHFWFLCFPRFHLFWSPCALDFASDFLTLAAAKPSAVGVNGRVAFQRRNNPLDVSERGLPSVVLPFAVI